MRNIVLVIMMLFSAQQTFSQQKPYKGNYELVARFSPEKLKKMVFSTSVSPHWLKRSDQFWYEYKTSDGNNWYLVDPVRKSKKQLFNKDKLAMEISRITKDPVDGQHLELDDLRFMEDENTIKFKVKGSEDVLKSDWEEIKEKDKNSKDSMEKRTFVFHYNIRNQQITEIIDAPKDDKRLSWASISPDSSRIVFAKHHNLFWMDKENFMKAVNDEKDSTIVEHQLTKNGE